MMQPATFHKTTILLRIAKNLNSQYTLRDLLPPFGQMSEIGCLKYIMLLNVVF
jgi:hypothetical protein